jgi:hypothetical protein
MVERIGAVRHVDQRRTHQVDPLGFQSPQLGSQARLGEEKWARDGGCQLGGGGDLIEVTLGHDHHVVGADEHLPDRNKASLARAVSISSCDRQWAARALATPSSPPRPTLLLDTASVAQQRRTRRKQDG